MKPKSNCLFFHTRLLIYLLFVLLSVSVALVGFGAISKAFRGTGESTGLPRTTEATGNAQPHAKDVTLTNDVLRYLDTRGNRAGAIRLKAGPAAKHRAKRPAGAGAWSSLGPPGGDVFDAAVSTADSSIALAGIAPDGSFGGTLYRSSDEGNTWSEVQPLDGISVFDIEFASDGTAFLGTQDSVRESTDNGLSWVTLNLGIGANDQVFDVALDPSNSSTIWAGIADASGLQPVNVMRSTDGGATWANRTPPLAAPISG